MVIGPSDRPDHDQAGSGSGARRSGRLRSRVSAWMTNNTRTVMAVTHAAAGMPGHAVMPGRGRAQAADQPPSMLWALPLTTAACSPARKSAIAATSSGSASLGTAECPRKICSRTSSSLMPFSFA